MRPIGLTTDRNSLRKLLRFSSGKGPHSWRIDVDIIQDTMFFTRWEKTLFSITTEPLGSGHGTEFEKAFLRFDSDLQESSAHHRIIRYHLGGIECLVRYEVDGYIDDDELCDQVKSSITIDEPSHELNPDTKTSTSQTGKVKVIAKGRLVNNDTILELKSRSNKLKMSEIMRQLWISQTHNLFVGRHKNGLVDVEPKRIEMDQRLRAWESENQENLRRMVSLIKEIKKVAAKVKGGKCVLVCEMKDNDGVLRMYERKGRGLFVPREAEGKCWTMKASK